MTRVAILVPRYNRGDAVSNDAIGMMETLAERGAEARVFAGEWDKPEAPLVIHHVKDIAGFLRSKSDILIYHYSIAWDVAENLFRDLDCVKILKYHNVTPAHFFEPYHEGIANSCRVGRERLKEFIGPQCDFYLGDSRYNLDELIERGAPRERSAVVAPFTLIEEIFEREADLDVLADYVMDYPEKPVNILSVGRLVPNKGYENLIRSFAYYKKFYNENSRLILVGRRLPVEDYYLKLYALIDDLDLNDDVIFTGGVSAAALKSFYLAADVYMIFSEHEGFCVPLVEAMALGIPTLAFSRAAVPETAGAGALLWDEADPRLFAASLDRIMRDQELGWALGEAGRTRFQERFTRQRIARDFLKVIAAYLDEAKSP